MSMLEWAKREVEIACKRENPDKKEGEFDYGCACYESALKAFESLCEDGHSGMSIGFTKNILNRLIDGKPLTPIEDTDDVWSKRHRSKDLPYVTFQCKRMSSLFKMIYNDGHVEYTDVDRYYCKDIDNPIGGFKITDTSIYSGVKNSITNPTRGLHIDKTGQLSLGDSDEYLRYYENDDGDWILEISSSSVKLSTTGKTVEEEIEGIKNDMNGRLTDVETRVTHAETSLEAHDNAISLKASTETVTDISNKTNELDKALEDAKTVIQENRDAIATLTARDFKIEFTTIMEQITALNGDLTSYKQEIGNWMRFDANGNLVLGATRVEGQDAYELKLTKNRISFMLNDVEVAYISSNNLYITNSTVVQNLKIGRFVWEVRGNGNLGLMYR